MKDLLTGIQHVGIPTLKYQETLDFYKTIGFDLVYETKQPNGLKVGFLDLYNLQVEIYEAEKIADMTGAYDHVAIDCNDIEKAFKRAHELGLEVIQDEIEALDYWDNGVRFFHVLGINKERVEFCQKL